MNFDRPSFVAQNFNAIFLQGFRDQVWIGFKVVIAEGCDNSMTGAYSFQDQGTGPDLLGCLPPKRSGVCRGDKVSGNDDQVGIQTIHAVNHRGNVLLADILTKVEIADLNQPEAVEFRCKARQPYVDRRQRELIRFIGGKAQCSQRGAPA